MSDIEKNTEKMDKSERESDAQDTVNDPAGEPQDEPQRLAPGLRDRVRKFLDAGHTKPGTKTDQKKDRTGSMALLIGGVVGAMLLFVGVFSTPPRPLTREPGGRAAPNLGRPAPPNQSAAVQGSVTPLLNADIQSQDSFADQLSPADIRGTSPRSVEADELGSLLETANVNPGVPAFRTVSQSARKV
jgi:hypothetical protein